MTPKEAADEVIRLEGVANRKPQGANILTIIQTVADANGLDVATVRAAVRDATVMGPN
jgi:hypothetical protein